LAINANLSLVAVPKTAATLANLQLHAQFHDEFSVFQPTPVGIRFLSFFRGVKRIATGSSGFFRPDGGLPLVFPRFLSCSWRADPGIFSRRFSPQAPLQSVLGLGGIDQADPAGPAAVHYPLKGRKSARFSPSGNETFPKDSHKPSQD
jgi:hypothetical protein